MYLKETLQTKQMESKRNAQEIQQKAGKRKQK
jgi:hypothetical protein